MTSYPFAPTIGLTSFIPSFFQGWTKHLPVDRLVNLGQQVSILVYSVLYVPRIEKAGLDHRGLLWRREGTGSFISKIRAQ